MKPNPCVAKQPCKRSRVASAAVSDVSADIIRVSKVARGCDPRLSRHVSREVNCHPQHAIVTCPLSRHETGRTLFQNYCLQINGRSRLAADEPRLPGTIVFCFHGLMESFSLAWLNRALRRVEVGDDHGILRVSPCVRFRALCPRRYDKAV